MRYTSISLILLWIQVSQAFAQVSSEYNGQVTFPANYSVGDYIEFLEVSPMSAGASGYYELSISYVRENIAAAATYLASISHYNPSLWRRSVGSIVTGTQTKGLPGIILRSIAIRTAIMCGFGFVQLTHWAL